ncbi:LysR family transcriptional regulator [Acetobacteraceae bacterium KSS8]|uniref:LysR family transcriptional regulator n=1 Tax=Endosaccharibacter trunci TaxID=2812733 RepID=A0ABT1W7I6_9PROT|nr:LysR family transcriptional regulator [Acetobacteraceae bacterium KSS8]
MPELRLLRSFVMVAREGGVTRAAERLGMAQPPLTRQIAALEAELGTRLFDRTTRGMRLTETGEALLEEADALIDRHEAMLRRIRRNARGQLGRLCVGLTSSALCHPDAASVLRRFGEAWPDVELIIRDANTGPLLRELSEGDVDVALLRTPNEQPEGIALERLTEEPMVVAVPRGHALAARSADTPIALAELRDAPFVSYRTPDNPGFHAAILQACALLGFVPNEAQIVPRMLSALTLIETGLGVSLFPASMERFAGGDVAIRPLAPGTALCAPLFLAFARLPMSASKRNFISTCRKHLRRPEAQEG